MVAEKNGKVIGNIKNNLHICAENGTDQDIAFLIADSKLTEQYIKINFKLGKKNDV